MNKQRVGERPANIFFLSPIVGWCSKSSHATFRSLSLFLKAFQQYPIFEIRTAFSNAVSQAPANDEENENTLTGRYLRTIEFQARTGTFPLVPSLPDVGDFIQCYEISSFDIRGD